jgi:hypothetical protein
MKTAQLQFQVKRGAVDMDALDDDTLALIEGCLQLVREGQHEKAVDLLRRNMKFEWIWGNCDGDPAEVGASGEDILLDLSVANTPQLLVGESNDALVITASVNFNLVVADNVDAASLTEWLESNSCYACGTVSAGWGYSGSDGENVWVLSA